MALILVVWKALGKINYKGNLLLLFHRISCGLFEKKIQFSKIISGYVVIVWFYPLVVGTYVVIAWFYALVVGANTMVLDVWGTAAASPMHSLHFGFGLGALLAPQLARPFLSPDNDTESNGTATEVPETCEDLSRIEIPYSIIGVLIICFSFVLFGFFLKGAPAGFPLRAGNTNFKTMLSPGSCGYGYIGYGVVVFAWLSFYFMQAIGGERSYGKFLFSFATENEDIGMSKNQASGLQTWFWFSFTTGRFFGIFITKFVPLRYVIAGDVVGNIVTTLVLATLATSSATALWVATFFMAAFISVVFPNGMIWGNEHLRMNSMGVMVVYVGGSLGGMVYQYITGYFFENYGPNSLMYIMVMYSFLLLVAVAGMSLTVFCMKPNVFEPDEDQIVRSVDDVAIFGSSYVKTVS